MADGVVCGAGEHVVEDGDCGRASGGRVWHEVRMEGAECPLHPLPFELPLVKKEAKKDSLRISPRAGQI